MTENGQHLVVDYWGCSPEILNDESGLREGISLAAEASGAKVLSTHSHKFHHQGVTAIAILSESHLSIHTWPDNGYAAVDIYTCGSCNPLNAHEKLIEILSPERVERVELNRGDSGAFPSISSRPGSPLICTGESPDGSSFVEGTVPGSRYGNVNHGFRITRKVFQARTPFQECLIFDNPVYGRVLVLDGIVQLSTFDEHIYHEMLVHPPLFTSPDPKSVCIVGGGDGGTLREVLKHNPERVTMIDIDEAFVRAAEQHLPSLSDGSFSDPRVTFLFEDAKEALKQFDRAFDVMIIDCNDAIGPSEALFEQDFYQSVSQALKEDGVCSVQVGSLLDVDFVEQTRNRIAASLGAVANFRLTLPCYHCGEYLFVVASHSFPPSGPDIETLTALQKERGVRTSYWSPSLHHASQSLPQLSAFHRDTP